VRADIIWVKHQEKAALTITAMEDMNMKEVMTKSITSIMEAMVKVMVMVIRIRKRSPKHKHISQEERTSMLMPLSSMLLEI
jgi:hypothetical protein